MSAHTPGPWRMEFFSGAYSVHGMLGGRAERRDTQLAEVRNFTPNPTPGERAEIDANANLIAAAPELLAALRRLTDRVDPATKTSNTIKSFSQAIDAARAAIAKAGVR